MEFDLERDRDAGRILDDAFALYRANWMTLLACAFVVVVPVQVLVFGIGLGWLTGHYDASPPFADSLAGSAAQLLVVTPLVTAMSVHVVLRAAQGARAMPGEAMSAGFDAFSRLFLPIVLVALGVGVGLFFLIIPGVILLVRWAVVPQVVVVEGVTGGEALRRSVALVAGRGWFVFLVVLVANVVVGVVGVVFTVPLEVAAKSADAQALSLTGQIAGQLFALPFLAVALTLLYYALRARPAGAPAPRAEPAPPPPTAPPPPSPDPDSEYDPFGRRRDEGWEPPVKDY